MLYQNLAGRLPSQPYLRRPLIGRDGPLTVPQKMSNNDRLAVKSVLRLSVSVSLLVRVPAAATTRQISKRHSRSFFFVSQMGPYPNAHLRISFDVTAMNDEWKTSRKRAADERECFCPRIDTKLTQTTLVLLRRSVNSIQMELL